MHVVLLPLARVSGAKPELAADEIKNLYVYSALQSIEPEADRGELAGLSLTDGLRRVRGVESQTRTLVFDQFEELFTSELVYELYGDLWQEQQEDFFAQVSQAIADDPMLRVVFLMRKEYLAELERFTPRLPEHLQTRFHLEPLDADEALAAVEGPLRNTHRSFADGVARKLVDKLLAMRVGPEHDVRGRFVEPVQLQVVCRRLWQDMPGEATIITESDMLAFGDVDTVLGQFYDEAVHAAASAAHVRERRLRARLEADFITSIGTRGTVYLQDWKRLSTALDELERRHVVHAEFRAGTQWYELTHDRLIDPIRTSNGRLRRRMAVRLAVGGGLAAAAAIVVTGVVVGYRNGTSPRAPIRSANILLATPTTQAMAGTKRPVKITVNAVGGATLASGGGTATASITSGPGRFDGPASCNYPGGRASGSCSVFISSAIPGTTVVTAASRISLAGDFTVTRATAGTAGNGSPAATTWVEQSAQPGITISPSEQSINTGGAATFAITITNTGDAALKDGTVTSEIAPLCNHRFGSIAPGASRSYHCSRPNTTAGYTNVATISSKGLNRWTASARVLLLSVRRSIVEAALAAVRRQTQIEYSPTQLRMQGVREKIRLPKVPRYEDTSSFVTWCYWQAGAPDPNGRAYDLTGNTATLINRGTPTPKPTPGDLVFYGSREHLVAVGIYVGNGRVVIHTNDEPTPRSRPLHFRSDFPLLEFRRYDLSRGHNRS
jgi:cell wall-associated NlpC family hydrolase